MQNGDGEGRQENGGFLSGFFLGALTGAALALIATPQTGEETRDLLKAKAREASARARDAAGDLTERASDVYARGKKAVDDARSTVDAAVDEGKAAAQSQRSELENQQ